MKLKKLGLILFSIAAAAFCAGGLAACDSKGEDNKEDSQIYSVYQTYVAHAESNGQTALSYEEWLNSIKGEKGDKGDTGAQGEKGDKGDDGVTPFIGENGNWWIGKNDTDVKAQGDKGDDGIGIQSVTINDNGELVITDTNSKVIYQGAIPSCVHTYGEPVDLIATCATHLVSKSCTKCGDMQVATATPIAHTPEDWTCDDTNHWRICSVCQNEVDKGEHTINGQNICTDCGYVKDATVGLQYTLYNGYYAVSGIGTATDTDIVIPSYYQGLPVKEIGDESFLNCVSLISITVPDSVIKLGNLAFVDCYVLTSINIGNGVTSIGESAFYRCSALTSVTIGNGVISIGDNAFRDCSGLTNIFIPDSVTSVGNLAFYNCNDLKNVTIGNGVTSIGESAFYRCIALTSINIPDSVTSIGNYAFGCCYALTNITIPDSVTSIGESTFSLCRGLTSIIVSENNTAYASKDGILYNKEKTEFICIPQSLQGNIIIPNTITGIANESFSNRAGLKSITIPEGVTRIGERAFSDCSELTSITYNGTMAQWNAITKDSSWNSNTNNYTVTCSNGKLDKDGNVVTA